LLGAEAAIREPRRAALGLMLAASCDDAEEFSSRWFTASESRTFRAMAERGINSPLTSSIGRLFDAVAALAGVCEHPTYDGQAAMQLEWALDSDAERADSYPMSLSDSGGKFILDWEPMLNALVADLREKTPPSLVSARFHNALVDAGVGIAERIGVEQVALGGGCFQNSYLCRRIEERLSQRGFRVYRPRQVPANDGGIALGQLAIARSLWEKESHVPRHSR